MTKAKTPALKTQTKGKLSESAAPAKVKTPTKAQRDLIEMERAAQFALGRAQAASGSNEKTAPVEYANVDDLAAALLQKLAPAFAAQQITNDPSKALADAITPVGSMCQGEKSLAASSMTSGYITASGSSLRPVNPVDLEFNLLESSIVELNNVIDDLNVALEPALAYDREEVCADSREPAKDSESPNHLRLITLNENMSHVIRRLRYMRSRVRN